MCLRTAMGGGLPYRIDSYVDRVDLATEIDERLNLASVVLA